MHRTFKLFLMTLLVCACSQTGYAAQLTLVDTFATPAPYPQMALDYDPSNDSLWSIDNDERVARVMDFDLSGNYLSDFGTTSNWNHTGVAVNGLSGDDQRIYYYENLSYNIRESLPDGTLVSTTQLLWGYQNVASKIEYDSLTGYVVVPHTASGSLSIPNGIDFVDPGVGIVDSVNFEWPDVVGFGSIGGFALDDDTYWFLGSDVLAGVDRDTLALVDSFVLPDSGDEEGRYRALAWDPETQRFYTHYLPYGADYRGVECDAGEEGCVSRDPDIVDIRVFELGEGQQADPSAVPEPATMLLFGTGLLGFGLRKKKR